MRLLLDTHILVWAPTGDPRLSKAAIAALENPESELFVSAVTAFEFADLQKRGRFAMTEPLSDFADLMGLQFIDFPSACWSLAASLPDIHRDPVDRMLVAHALVLDMTLVTADVMMRRYPVKLL